MLLSCILWCSPPALMKQIITKEKIKWHIADIAKVIVLMALVATATALTGTESTSQKLITSMAVLTTKVTIGGTVIRAPKRRSMTCRNVFPAGARIRRLG